MKLVCCLACLRHISFLFVDTSMFISQCTELTEKMSYSISTKQLSTRDGYGQGLLQLGEKDPRVVALCADLIETIH